MSDRPNLPPLRLHVPEPKFRPGDEADFGDLVIPEAGVAPRPAVESPPADFHELAYSLVRVLDGEGRAIGPWNPKLDAETLRKALAGV